MEASQRRFAGVIAFLRRLARNRLALAGAIVVVLMVLAALLAPWIAPYDPEEQFPREPLQSPSSRFLLGTDNVGRDTLSRVIFGARVSLFVGLTSMAIAAAVGIPLGLVSGYYGGVLHSGAVRGVETPLALPAGVVVVFLF